MKFYQRAWRYIRRKKGKTIVLFLVLLFVNSMMLSTKMITSATTESQEAIKEKTKVKVIVEAIKEEEGITEQEVDKIQRLDGVAFSNRLAKKETYVESLQPITYSESLEEANSQVTFLTYDNTEIDSGFEQQSHQLITGSHLKEDTQGVLLHDTFAMYNSLTVGDSITVVGKDGSKVEVPIVGIFLTSGSERYQEKSTVAKYRIENQIYIDTHTYHQIYGEVTYTSVVVYSIEPEQMDILANASKDICQEKVTVVTSDALYRQMKAPLEQIVRITTLLFQLTVITGSVVITLLLSLWMRTRKHEIAILMSLGEEKRYIVMQVLLETLFIFMVAIMSACGLGNIITPWIAQLFSYIQGIEMTIPITMNIQHIQYFITVGGSIILLAIGCSLIPIFITSPKESLSEMEG